MKTKKRIVKIWSDEEIVLLKTVYNKSYSELEGLFPGRTKRALKHKIGLLGLKRMERKRWSEQERSIVEENVHLTPKGLVEFLPGRSEYQIAKWKRQLLGTANRQLKKGCGVPSKDLAYFVGALCSDGYMSKYMCEFTQHKKDVVFVDRIGSIIYDVFGLRSTRTIHRKKSQTGYEDDYEYLGTYSRELFKAFATEKAKRVNNVKPDNEWVDMVDEKFPWVWENKWMWSFLSGLMDGDGCVKKNSVTIAIAGERSASKVIAELGKKGWGVSRYGVSISIKGGNKRREEFLKKLDLAIDRKKSLKNVESEEVWVDKEVVSDGVHRILMDDAKVFMAKNHYLGTVPVGTISYGYYKDGILKAVASFGTPQVVSWDAKTRELKRFAADGLKASHALMAIIKKMKSEELDAEVLVTYADGEYHDGTIYKATNAIYLGDTGKTIKVMANGKEYGGRYLAQTLENAGVDVKKAELKIVPGKKRFVYVLATGKRKKELNKFFINKAKN